MKRTALVRGVLALAALALLTSVQYGGVPATNFGAVDEWLSLDLTSRSLLAFPHTNRPLTLLWGIPGFHLTPYRFEGYLIVHLAYLTAVGWLTWLLVGRLAPEPPGLAFIAGALAICWAPLDMARLMAVPALASGVTAATMLAIVLFVESWRRERLWLLGAAMAVALVAAKSYEATLGLLFGTPLLCAFVEGRPRTRARRLLWIGGWEAGCAALAALAAIPMLRGGSASLYQSEVLRLDAHPARYAARIAQQFVFHLAPLAPADLSELGWSSVAAALAFVVGAAAAGALGRSAAPSRRRVAGLAALGLALAAMGYSVLSLSAATAAPTRMQFLSAPGIALFLAAAIGCVVSFVPPRAAVATSVALAAAVVAAGAGHTASMQRQWDRITYYPRQRDCLVQLVREAPALRSGTLLLLIDEDRTWPYALTFRHAARLVYGDRITAHAVGVEQLLYAIQATPAGVRVMPWPVIQRPWHEQPTDHRYDEVIAFRLSGGVVSRLEQWSHPLLPALPAGARYAPAERITSAPPPPGRRVLD